MTTAILLFKTVNQDVDYASDLIEAGDTRHLPVIWLNILSDNSSNQLVGVEDGEDEHMNSGHRQMNIECPRERHSAFVHTCLEKYLLKQKVRSLVVGGVINSDCFQFVKNTVQKSVNLGFTVKFLLDFTSFSDEHHQNEIEQIIQETGGKSQTLKSTLEELDTFGEGDSRVIYDFIPPSVRQEMGLSAQNILNEVQWCIMRNRGIQVPRLIAIQGEIDPVTGAQPLYRHPADEQPALVPFTPIVNQLRLYLSAQLQQPFNHVLIQYYRNGKDNIGEHSDKTLDILKNTAIVNFSLGVTRIMHLKRKKLHPSHTHSSDATDSSPTTAAGDIESLAGGRKYEYQRVVMRDNSLFQLGWETNRRWLHAIRTDKRPSDQKYMDEVCHEDNNEGSLEVEDDSEDVSNKSTFSGRISFTFRTIATFLSADGKTIFGQGAPAASETAGATAVTNPADEEEEALRMLKAFSRENHEIDYDWDDLYGKGFSTLNFRIINQ